MNDFIFEEGYEEYIVMTFCDMQVIYGQQSVFFIEN